MTAVLEIIGLSKAYGAARVLHGVSLSVAPGEVVALLGPSGSGKTTLFRCATRLVAPDAGEVRLDGVGMAGLSRAKLRRQRARVGLIFQQFNLVGRRSAIGNVLGGALGRVAAWRIALDRFPEAERQAALGALDRVGLLAHAYQRADRLSGGQQQRVAIARVLAQRARLILADEPVSALDPASAANVLETLRGVARAERIGVLVSLHQVEYARAFADRIVAMAEGRVLFDRAAALLDGAALHAVYGPRALEPA